MWEPELLAVAAGSAPCGQGGEPHTSLENTQRYSLPWATSPPSVTRQKSFLQPPGCLQRIVNAQLLSWAFLANLPSAETYVSLWY